jgi:type II secretory pathway pseudopilin PulG
MQKKYLFYKSIRSEKGSILIGIIVLIVLSAIAFSTAMYVLGDAIQRKKQSETMKRLRRVETALFGSRYAFINDASANFGYFSRNNGITTTIANLLDLQSNFTSFSSTLDSYGRAIDLDNSGGNYSIYSYGLNGVDNGGAGDDLMLRVPTAARTTVDIEVQVMDASRNTDVDGSGNVGVLESGKAYVIDNPNNNLIDGVYDGHILLDNNTVEVDLLPTPAYEGTANANPTSIPSAGVYRWDNVPIGTYMLRVRATGDNATFDPFFQDSLGLTRNTLYTPIFVHPTHTTVRRQFNVIYPIVAVLNALQETGDDHGDYTVTSNNEYWDAMNDPDNNGAAPWDQALEYQCVGNGCPDYRGYNGFVGAGSCVNRVMRSLVRFNLAALPNWNTVAPFPKVTFAKLILSRHSAPAGPLGWSSAPRGAGAVQIWRYNHAWNETNASANPYTPLAGAVLPNGMSWAEVQTTPADYSDMIDTWTYNADPNHFFEVTQAVQNWADGTWPNYGFLVKHSSEAINNWWSFKSNESAAATLRPRLVVKYYE